MTTFGDDRRLSKLLAPHATGTASIVVKNTISSETPDMLSTITRWPPLGSFFTHRLLFLRDPVQQYLSVRHKPWCANCGGFAAKMGAQDAVVRRCIEAADSGHLLAPEGGEGRSGCPFDALVFDRAVFGGFDSLSSLFDRLGLLTSNASRHLRASALERQRGMRSKFGRTWWQGKIGVRVQMRARRARNAALGIPLKLVSAGNMHGEWLRAGLASRRASWSCAIARRVRELQPTLYQLYHPQHCDSPHVRNASDAEILDDISGGRRRTWHAISGPAQLAAGHARPSSYQGPSPLAPSDKPPGKSPGAEGGLLARLNKPMICDSFTDRDLPDCSTLPVKVRGACEGTAINMSEVRAARARWAARKRRHKPIRLSA